MMDALDRKFELAVRGLRVQARRRQMPFKELIVRIASEQGAISIPLWNEDFDAMLAAREGGAE